eukprot:11225189-Lingulodinium_polyedra.AAC.1
MASVGGAAQQGAPTSLTLIGGRGPVAPGKFMEGRHVSQGETYRNKTHHEVNAQHSIEDVQQYSKSLPVGGLA